MNKTTLQKIGVVSLALLTAFAVNARAQGHYPNASHQKGTSHRNLVLAPPPGALWYNGDFDFVDGLTNEENTFATGYAHIFDNFEVTDGGGWDVTSVFSHDLILATLSGATWEIRSGVSGGNPGTLVASGDTDSPIVTPTGNSAFGFDEFMVEIPVNVHLGPGTYWLHVTPVGVLDGGRSFNSTTDGTNCVGTPCGSDDTAFLDSDLFGAFFEPVADFGSQFHDFSMGVIGTVVVGGDLTLDSAVSRKTHGAAGAFDINLPLSGSPGIEDRQGQSRYMIVFTFSNNVTSVGGVTSTCGSVGRTLASGNTFQVNLRDVDCNGSVFTVSLSDVEDDQGNTLSSASVDVGLLIGDVNGDGTVGLTDYNIELADHGQTTDGTNFRADVTGDGSVTNKDLHAVRNAKGDSL